MTNSQSVEQDGIVAGNTAQNSSDSLPSYPVDNHHCTGVVHWRGGEGTAAEVTTEKKTS